MPIKSKQIVFNSLRINQVEGEEQSGTTPFNLYVYQLPDIIVKSNTTPAEYFVRQQNYGFMKPFQADYYVDHKTIYSVSPAYQKVLKIGVCGTRKGIEQKAFQLIKTLAKFYEIALNQIFFYGFTDEFIENFQLFAEKSQVKKKTIMEVIPKITEQQFVPIITYEVYFNEKWQQPDGVHEFSSIKIKTNIGDLHYRVHFQGWNWSPWTDNGIAAGLNQGIIDGIQFEYKDNKYQLYIQSTLKGKGILPWKNSTPLAPYGFPLINIAFKLRGE